MKLSKIKTKTITYEVPDVPHGSRVKVPTQRLGDGIYRVEQINGDDICVCVVDDEYGCEYEWYHYTECKLIEYLK